MIGHSNGVNPMDKRYQVFVSSTYADLRDERRKVIQTLMEIDCIPAGMELFPAADEEQWEFIKRVIDDCDYYLLIIGGRYGSTDPEGVSFTEKEYDYAIERGIRVIALLHEKPDILAVEKSDINPELRARLIKFREKVSQGRLVKFWNTPAELPGLVAINVPKTIKAYPALGWLRGHQAPYAETLAEINDLRKTNAELEKTLTEVRGQLIPAPSVSNLVPLEAPLTIFGLYEGYNRRLIRWHCETTWREIYGTIAPHLLAFPNDSSVQHLLAQYFVKKKDPDGQNASVDDEIFQTIKVQFLALGLINVQYVKSQGAYPYLYWSITDTGRKVMLEIRSVKAESATPKADH